LALVLLVVTAIVDKAFFVFIPGLHLLNPAIPWIRAGVHLLSNLILAIITIQLLKSHQIKVTPVVTKPRPVAVAPEPPASVIS
jgi:hypothetical protein